MKNIIKSGLVVLTIAVAVTIGSVVLTSNPANAETISANCRPSASPMTESGGKVSVKFNIAPNCPVQHLNLAVYKTVAGIGAFSTQKLYSYDAQPLGSGEHTLTANLPDDCFYQADLMSGMPVSNPQDDGVYDVHMWRVGGSRDCVTAPPATPVAPVTPAAAPAKPAALPVTGPGAVVGIVTGVSLTSGLGYSLVSRFRSRQ